MAERRAPEPTELVYLPKPSWAPAFTAVGLAVLFVGLFKGWVLIVVGAVILLAALRVWVRDAADTIGRLPRHQRLTSAVIPAAPLRQPQSDD
jgi:O-antigen ligase